MDSTGVLVFLLCLTVGFAALVALPVGVVVMRAWHWWRMAAIDARNAAEFIAPDEHGRLPVARNVLRTEAGAAQTFATYQHSYMQNVTSLNYSPKYNSEVNGVEPQAAATPALQPQTFWQLYQGHKLPSSGFLMGYNLEDGSEVRADWKELYSTLLGGQSGSGKSTLIRSLLAQSALQGGRFVVIDPHLESGNESLGATLQALRPLMLTDVACNEPDMIDALRFVGNTAARRLQGLDQDRTPLVLVTDETTGLLQRSAVAQELTKVLGQISQESRKVGVFAMCIGQNFSGKVIDTTVRDSFVSMLSMRARRRTARVQADDPEFGEMAETLTVGQAVWKNPNGDVYRLAVPNCTAADLELVAGHFSGKNTQTVIDGKIQREVPTSKGTSKGTSNALEDDQDFDDLEVPTEELLETKDPRSERVRMMVRAGHSQGEILAEIWNVKAKGGGRKYQEANEELRQILAKLV